MDKQDFGAFAQELHDFAILINRSEPDDRFCKLMFNAFKNITIDEFRRALAAHMQDPDRGRYMPVPADIIKHIVKQGDQWPSADEAWSIAVQACDESASVVWTQQIAEACGLASPIYADGDKIGARMAFRSAYERVVDRDRKRGVLLRWVASYGTDHAGRIQAVENAKALGRDPGPVPFVALPHEPVELLESNASTPEFAREQIAKLRNMLKITSSAGSKSTRTNQD